MARGLFIVFEGIDGSGKSTQARRVAAARGALFTFEPGDSLVGADLRRWLLDESTAMTPSTEALLMMADRAHHVATVIEPALSAGTSVVSDRYNASTLAYQGYGRGVDLAALEQAATLAVGNCVADLTVLLDVPVEVAVSRRAPRREDRFESAANSFHEAVRRGFLELAERSPEKWLVVDGRQSEDEVAAAIDDGLDALEWPVVA